MEDTVRRYREEQQKLSQKGRNCFTKNLRSPETLGFIDTAERVEKFYKITKAVGRVNKGFVFNKYYNAKIRGCFTKRLV